MWYVGVIGTDDSEASVEDVYTYFIEGESRENAAALIEERLDADEWLVYLRPVPSGVVGTDESDG